LILSPCKNLKTIAIISLQRIEAKKIMKLQIILTYTCQISTTENTEEKRKHRETIDNIYFLCHPAQKQGGTTNYTNNFMLFELDTRNPELETLILTKARRARAYFHLLSYHI